MQLLAAGERVLLEHGPAAVTSRAVTDEAGVAKGVLHRHFPTFDDFLGALLGQQLSGVTAVMADLLDRAGHGTVLDNLAAALVNLFRPLLLAAVRLQLSRVPRLGPSLLGAAIEGVTAYLAAEQGGGRLHTSAAPDALARAVVGTGHLLFSGELGGLPDDAAVREVVEAIIVGAVPGPAEQPRH